MIRDLHSPDGAFYSSEDADSEGQEGKFYIWMRSELDAALEAQDAALFASHYDVSEVGNWMHPGDTHVPQGPKNVLQVSRPTDVLAKQHGLTEEGVRASLEASRETLFRLRSQRVRPGLDDKILTGWNGLMIAALARTATVLEEPAYGEAAARAADFLRREVRQGDRLLASYGKGQARLTGYSTDYAFLVEGLIALYEWSAEPAYLLEAERLTDSLVQFHWDPADGGFFLTASDHEELLLRSKTIQDGATPSANSTMALNLQKLAILLGRQDYREKAGALLRLYVDPSPRAVFQQERLLCALDAWHRGWDEIAIIGPSEDPRTQALLAAAHASYRPNKVVARAEGPGDLATKRIPLLANRGLVKGCPAAYVCRDYVCRRPVTDPGELFQIA